MQPPPYQDARSVPPRAVYVTSQPGIEMFGRVISSAPSKRVGRLTLCVRGKRLDHLEAGTEPGSKVMEDPGK